MANPVLNEETFAKTLSPSGAVMTVQGAVGKSILLGALCVLAGVAGWHFPQAVLVAPVVLILGLVIAIVLSFKPAWSAFLAPVYALLEGVFLGSVSAIFEANYPGIAVQVVGTTAGVFFAMLGAYQLRLIRPTRRFRAIVMAATFGLMIFYLVNMAVSFFNGTGFSIVSGNSGIAILFSIGACVLAALNLIVDFGVMEEGAEVGAPKYMEWYAAFGLLVTMVWLYLELLRLLSKLRSR